MPMKRLVWVILGMVMFHHVLMILFVNQLYILLSGVCPLRCSLSRQKLRDKSIERLFH